MFHLDCHLTTEYVDNKQSDNIVLVKLNVIVIPSNEIEESMGIVHSWTIHVVNLREGMAELALSCVPTLGQHVPFKVVLCTPYLNLLRNDFRQSSRGSQF